ncbi:hypothetical protein KUTeg_011141 [Tegillarca granosa]|uniref:C-type lectin domain-containing protein n=1 Tax=Tegillarca granosa TaxID=220873 RepID=A0ABQ9F6S6_TEGGR|nr:hypothetical protein KUTeg_011141 [Tegillarca granosa]
MNVFKRNTFLGSITGGIWVGVNDIDAELHFSTWDGYPQSYFNWMAGQPNGYPLYPATEQDCIAMFTAYNYTWQDKPCSESHRCLCSYRSCKLKTIIVLNLGLFCQPGNGSHRYVKEHYLFYLKFLYKYLYKSKPQGSSSCTRYLTASRCFCNGGMSALTQEQFDEILKDLQVDKDSTNACQKETYIGQRRPSISTNHRLILWICSYVDQYFSNIVGSNFGQPSPYLVFPSSQILNTTHNLDLDLPQSRKVPF